MSGNPYERVRGGRLTFKGGDVATRSKTITKKKNKKNKINKQLDDQNTLTDDNAVVNDDDNGNPNPNPNSSSGEVIYTIDAAKKMKYEDLFPVEAKKFGYDPTASSKSIEDALDVRVKKKADRYCK